MLRIIMLCSLWSFSISAHAETEAYNRVDFQVEAAREVANDLLVTRLSADISFLRERQYHCLCRRGRDYQH